MTILKKLSIKELLLFLFCVLLSLACGGSSGASRLDSQNQTNTSTANQVKSYDIQIQVNATQGLSKSLKSIETATVMLYLASGESFEAVANADGSYTATIQSENYDPTTDSFLITAKKGDLELRYMSFAGDDLSQSFTVSSDSTTLALLATELVNQQTDQSTTEDWGSLLKTIKTRQLTSDLITLKSDFITNANGKYNTIKSAVTALYQQSNTAADSAQSLLQQFTSNQFQIGGQSYTSLFQTPVSIGTFQLGSNNFKTTFKLISGGFNQYLLPVRIGNQTFNLLVDTGSNAVVLFEDLIDPTNTAIAKTTTKVSKKYSSNLREGVLATAQVQVGGYRAKAMKIMVIQTPTSKTDASLTAKRADGIIGLRKTNGLTQNLDSVELDVPLSALEPAISTFELNLPPTTSGKEATLSFGRMPTLDQANSNFIFRAKTHSVAGKNIGEEFADLQVPFRAKTSFGEVNDTTFDRKMDILLDTGAVSKLVLDVNVATELGYSAENKSWSIPATEEIEFNLIGPYGSISLLPKFKISDIEVAEYISSGVSFEAVLGIDSWNEYVIGFHFVDFQSGAESGDGTLSFLQRKDLGLTDTQTQVEFSSPVESQRFIELPGLNSNGDDSFASIDNRGEHIVFQSNRNSGLGGWDVYVYELGTGILELPGLNSILEDSDPSISGDGELIVFHSNRTGGVGSYDIYMYNILTKKFIHLPGLNSIYLERNPAISPDGRYIVFRSERPNTRAGNRANTTALSDIYLYDIQKQAIVPTPALRDTTVLISGGYDYDPSVSENGKYISFDSDGQGIDVFLYDVENDAFVTIPQGANTSSDELASAISPDGSLIAFQSNRLESSMGKFNQDIFIYDLNGAVQRFLPGLNTEFNEIASQFNGNGAYLVFHSNRPHGEGATDIYVYRIKSTDVPSASSSVSGESLALSKTQSGLYTVKATVASVESSYLVDTGLDVSLVFNDHSSLQAQGNAFSFQTYHGNISVSTATTVVKVGQYTAETMTVLVASRTEYQTLTGRDMTGVSGVLGFSQYRHVNNSLLLREGMLLSALKPAVHMVELDMNAYGQATLTLGKRPATSKMDPYYLFNSYSRGESVISNSQSYEFTDFVVDSVLVNQTTQAGLVTPIRLLISTAEQNSLLLSPTLAALLGGSANVSQWTQNKRELVSVFIKGIESYLPIPSQYSVDQIKAGAFEQSDFGYDAILSLEHWSDFVMSYDAFKNDSGGPEAILSFVHRGDVAQAQTNLPLVSKTDRFVDLSVLNTEADEAFAQISADGTKIVFQSNRSGGAGLNDIYLFDLTTNQLVALTGINSSSEDKKPSLDEKGQKIVFESNRLGVSEGRPEEYDIYSYDVNSQILTRFEFNTELNETDSSISADGQFVSFSKTEGSVQNVYIYEIGGTTTLVSNAYNVLLNNSATGDQFSLSLGSEKLNERQSFLSTLISVPTFQGQSSTTELGYLLGLSTQYASGNIQGDDIALYRYFPNNSSLNGLYQFDLPDDIQLNSSFRDNSATVSPDGTFMLLQTNRRTPSAYAAGQDIYLFELNSSEFVYLPGIRSYVEDAYPSTNYKATKILFHSKRHDSEGGYDLYLYSRDF